MTYMPIHPIDISNLYNTIIPITFAVKDACKTSVHGSLA
jgi:hypothetical protein